MGPHVFDELATNISRLWAHCGEVPDKADNPVPPDMY